MGIPMGLFGDNVGTIPKESLVTRPRNLTSPRGANPPQGIRIVGYSKLAKTYSLEHA